MHVSPMRSRGGVSNVGVRQMGGGSLPAQRSEQRVQTIRVLIVLALIFGTYLLIVDWDELGALCRQAVHIAGHRT